MNPFNAMVSPWDFAAFAAWLKQQGLDVGEEGAKRLLHGSFAFAEKSAQLSPTPIDDLVVSVLKQFEPAAEAAIDKIDGQVG